jgi:hypothetical protein
MACPMFGKYAIRSLFSCVVSLELREIPSTDNKIIPTTPAEIITRIFIKQRYIWKLNNHRILAQASKKFFENKIDSSLSQKINSKI